jgi:hypothetical protein
MKNVEVAAKAATRKSYVRPELTKHGKVESLTQVADGIAKGCSHPLSGGSSAHAF